MNKRISAIFTAFLMITATGCSSESKTDKAELLGLEWFSSISEVQEKLENLTFIEKREKDEQIFLDYSDAEFLETICDVTVNFSEEGLIGLNYHDINKEKNYRKWREILQQKYGVPTEQGNGMASWYDNPTGKNTAMYLFNLQEGVQISFYSTSNTPDKSYKKKRDESSVSKSDYVPVPEIRTPIVPVEEESVLKETETTTEETQPQTTQNVYLPNYSDYSDNAIEETEIAVTGSVTAASTTTSSYETTTTTTLDVKNQEAYKQKELEFYITPEDSDKRMKTYEKSDDYKIEEVGESWEIVHEYTDVDYCGKKCDVVLCFTSLGLVGINYFDYEINNYDFWVKQLTEIYGNPSEKQKDFSGWTKSPLGEKTMIYLFRLDDGIQISFFADDTGSETA